MKSIFKSCEKLLEQDQFQEAIRRLPELVRLAESPMELIMSARVAGLALFPGLESRLLRRAVRGQDCPPEGFLRLASYHVSRGNFLLVDELLTNQAIASAWVPLDRAKAHGLRAVAMAARHRYRTAEAEIQHAGRLVADAGGEEPLDLVYDRLAVPYFAGRWEEVQEGLTAIIEQGRSNPNIYQLLARCHEHQGRPEVSLEVLRAASERFPDHPLLWSLQGGICWSLNRSEEATAALSRYGALLPFPRHQRHVARLQAIIARRVSRLPVPMVRQGRNHCFPACMAMVRSYWGQTNDQREIGSVVMDGVHGTPLYRAMQFLEGEGWVCRSFRATIERVKRLVDSGVPPILGLEYSGGAHVHVCVGYDDEHHELILQDPAHPYPARLRYRDFEEVYAQSDYWAMAFAPVDRSGPLEALPIADDRMIRTAQRLWEALREDDAPAASEAFSSLEGMGETPGLHLTRLRAWPQLGTRDGARLSADRLLAIFPNHVQIRTEVAQHLARLNEPGRAAAVVRELVGLRPAQAWLILADEASRSGRTPEEVIPLCRRAALMDQLNPLPLAEWGREEQRAGNLANAEALLRAAYEMDPQPAFSADLAALKADQGDSEGAIAGLRQVLRTAPRYPWAWWRRGEIHWTMGHIRSATRCLRIAVRQAPEDPHYLLRLSQVYQESGQEHRAAALLQESPHLRHSPDLLNSLAVLLLNQGGYQEAHDLARDGLARFSADPRFAPIAAEALRRMGRSPEGRAVLEAARQRMPDNAYLAGRLGQFLLEEGEGESGVAALADSLRLLPGWRTPVEWAAEVAETRASRPLLEFLETVAVGDLRWRVARLWLAIDRDRALNCARALLTQEGRTVHALTEFGRIAVDAEFSWEATPAFLAALQLQPNLPRACYGMALLSGKQRNSKAYAIWMQRAIEAATDEAMARRYADRFGDFLEQQGDWAGLDRLINQIEGRVPEGWRITYSGYANERQGRFELAYALYDRAQQIDPALAWPYFRRVSALLQEGRNREALAAAGSAAACFPRDVSIAWIRGRAHHAIGEWDKATEAYLQAVRLDPGWAPARRSLCQQWMGQGWRTLAEKVRDLPVQAQADLLAEWGGTYLEFGYTDEADGILRAAVDLDPKSDPASLGLARVAMHQRRLEESWDLTVKVLLRNPAAALSWLPDLCAKSPPPLTVRTLKRILPEMTGADLRVRAEVREHLAQALIGEGNWEAGLLVSEEALRDDPGHPGALRRLAAEHARRERWATVFDMLEPAVERRGVPAEIPDLVSLFAKAALFLNRPRRPHWREVILARLLYLRRTGAFAGTEARSLRQALTRLELEFGHIRSAWCAMAVRDAVWNGAYVALQWALMGLRHIPLDVRPGDATDPVLSRLLVGVRYEAPGRHPLIQRLVRVLGRLASLAYASPGTLGLILLLSALFSAKAGLLIGGVPVLLLVGLQNLPGIKREDEEPAL